MERYKEYRDSGVQWIGEIPKHWTLRRIKYIFSELKEKSENGLETPLSLSKEAGIIPFDEKKNKTMESASYVGGKIVHKGEIVFNRFKARLFAVSGFDGIVSSDYAVYECNKTASPKYMVKLFGTDIYRDAFNRKASGIGDGFSRLYTDDLFAMYSIFPPIQEQEKIVSYLESKTSKIDAYVEDKEKEIELLQEFKQKTIAEAVTKGLNPDVKMKDSGISWIWMIPEHWEKKQLRSFLTLFTEKGHGDAQLLSVTREQGVILRDKDNKEENHNFVPEDLSGYKYIEKGDFAINKMKAWQGSYAVSEYNGIVSPAYFTCKLKGVNKEFFSRAIRSKAYIPFFTQYSKGIRVDQWDLNPNALKSIPFLVPPVDEQQTIVSYVDDKCQKIDTLINELQAEIDHLKEYKQRLIADVVTGQVNVQNEA